MSGKVGLEPPGAFAVGVAGATPEFLTGIVTCPSFALVHGLATFGAGWQWFSSRCRLTRLGAALMQTSRSPAAGTSAATAQN